MFQYHLCYTYLLHVLYMYLYCVIYSPLFSFRGKLSFSYIHLNSFSFMFVLCTLYILPKFSYHIYIFFSNFLSIPSFSYFNLP